jgi:nucleosome binding factor SPN SPT16 subunit
MAEVSLCAATGFEELVPKLTKSIGFGTGLELRESRLQLTATNEAVAEAKMIFNVSVGVQDLSNPDATDDKDKTFAIQVCHRTVLGTTLLRPCRLLLFGPACSTTLGLVLYNNGNKRQDEIRNDSSYAEHLFICVAGTCGALPGTKVQV